MMWISQNVRETKVFLKANVNYSLKIWVFNFEGGIHFHLQYNLSVTPNTFVDSDVTSMSICKKDILWANRKKTWNYCKKGTLY
jgi:hypothetical protein